jgi:hypothetical protein
MAEGRARNLVLGVLAIGLAAGAVFYALRRWERPAAQAGPVWVCGDGLKVQPQMAPRPDGTFDPRAARIRLFAARQEYVAFQLVLRPADPLREVRMRFGPLRRDGGEERLGGENLDLFQQHMLRVTVASRNGPQEPVPGAQAGEYPAQLVPLARREEEGSSIFPYPGDVPAGRNTPVWVDLYVPEEQAPGHYRGEVEVLAGEERVSRLPLEVTVWRFALPRETHFKTFCEASTDQLRWAFGYRDVEAPAFRALEDQFFQLAHQHRINFNLSSNGTAADDMTRRYRSYLDGSAFRARAVPGVGLNLWMVGFQFEDVDGNDAASVTSFVKRVVALRRRYRWPAFFACYTLDEPHEPEEFALAARRCAWVHAAAGKELPTYLTTPEWQRLPTGAVDIWGELKAADIAGRQAAGQKVWAVNADYATGPYTDTPATAGRALIWTAWRLGLDAWHFWNCTYWLDRQNLMTPDGELLPWKLIDADPQRYLTDTWREPLTFDQNRRPAGKQKDQIRINGDGVLFYPGLPAGITGPLPSVSLKTLRRGLQDYEYLWLLKQRGVDTGATVGRLVPVPGQWERNPAAWEAARVELGRRLDANDR